MTAHPAKYSDEVLKRLCQLDIASHVDGQPLILDPFAGTGKIRRLRGLRAVGVEIEPEWATMWPGTIVANTLHLPFRTAAFDGLVTSPCYGNRQADHHNARDGSRRHSYTHTLGRQLHEGNAGTLQWGPAYRIFHHAAWAECLRVLKPGADLIVNVSNHIRNGAEQHVVEWHLTWFVTNGCELVELMPVETRRLREGANYRARVRFEYLLHFKFRYPGRRHDPPTRQMGTTMLTPDRSGLVDHMDT